MSKKVYGEYQSIQDAELAVRNLIKDGAPAKSILVLTNKKMNGELITSGVNVETVEDEHRGLWNRFKHFFGAEDYANFESTVLDRYVDNVKDGKTLVFVEENFISHLAKEVIKTEDAKLSVHLPENSTHEDIIKLVEEHLCIDKEPIQKGEVRFKKRIIETQETVTVPVMHEELVIERVASEDCVVNEIDFTEQSFIIPLMEERVDIRKVPVVTAEYRIGKRAVEVMRDVSGTVRSEELDEVDADGKIISVKN